jgi:sporulation protein YlmC with PRC-barrel domain
MNDLKFINTDHIIGQKVKNSLGYEYGKITDILVSPESGRIAAVIVAHGGFLGIGTDHFLLPWSSIQVNPNSGSVMTTADQATIEGAPEIEPNKIEGGDFRSLEKVYSYYGHKPFWNNPEKEEDPSKASYQSGHDIGDRNPTNEGSYQITQDHPPAGNPKREVNLAKMTGQPNQTD